jgi:hypothetical protein
MSRSAGKQRALDPETLEIQIRAEQELRACYESWYRSCVETGNVEQLEGRVLREVQRLQRELGQGLADNIGERFAAAVAGVEVSIQPRRKTTYLNMIATIRELSELNIRWYKAAPRSKSDQAWMLRQTRHLMLELTAGDIDNLPTRFQQLAEMIPADPAAQAGPADGADELEV